MKCTPTNSSGVGYLEIDVRGANNTSFTAYCNNLTARASYTPKINADYESSFYITYYITAKESDYSGTMEYPNGITDTKYPKDFIKAVQMNGSGITTDGRYLHYDSNTGKYSYLAPITCTQTTPTAGRTIAVDNTKIPRYHVSGSTYKRGKVFIQGIGERMAEDAGGRIQAFHIDVYTGEGKSSMTYHVTNAKVTFLGTITN